MLTVEEAARILRVGRTTGYKMAERWTKTGGEDGLPVIHVGRLLRVPTVLFEERFSLRVTSRTRGRIGSNRRQSTAPAVTGDEPTSPPMTPIQRPRRRPRDDQAALPFAG